MADKPHTVIVKPASALSAAETAAWITMRAANPALYSPYFHPDYTALIGTLREDAFVAVVMDGAAPIAFLPYQGPRSGGGGFARPIGAPMTDYHGFIKAAETQIDPVLVMKSAGLGALHFSALIDLDGKLETHVQSHQDCTVADISKGVDAWRQSRDSSYRRHLKSHRRRVRKAEEEIGPRRFAYKSQDKAVFDQLITWKKEKFTETGKYDVLSAGWTYDLLRQLWERGPEAALRADMQALYFGDRLAAVDLGLTDGTTFHSWIVGYDNALQAYAPGIQLLEDMIDTAAREGYSRIDLGAGTDGYKRHYASEPVKTGSGFVAVKGPAAALAQIYSAAERFGEKTLNDAPGKIRRRYSQIAACDDSLTGRAKAMFDAVKTSGKR